MQVFKAFFKIARKRLPATCIYLVIYTIITFIFSFSASDNFSENFQSTALSICIIDEDESEASRALCAYLGKLHKVETVNPDDETISDQLYYRTLDYVLKIPSGFEKQVIAQEKKDLLTDIRIPGSANGAFVNQQVTQYTSTLQVYLAGGCSLYDAIRQTDQSISNLTPVKKVSFDTAGAAKDTRVFYFYQYLPYIFIVMLFSGLAPILVIHNEKGLRDRTLCSSLSLTSRNMQLTLSSVIYSLCTWLLFMLLGAIVYPKSYFTTFALLAMLNSFIFLLFAAVTTLLVSLFSPNDNIVSMIANTVGLSISFFCGVFVPQSILPEKVLLVGRFLPAYWYIKNNDMLAGLSDEVFSLKSYLFSLEIQLLYVAAILAVTLALTKIRKQN